PWPSLMGHFEEVLYVNESSGEMAWFSRNSGVRTTIAAAGYNAAGFLLGEWTGHGVARTDTTYQLNICDDAWMWVGLMVSGYTGCWKQCCHRCSDTSTDYYRTDGDTGSSYNGVSFAENGHHNVSDKTMSVGIR
ncbi:MAG: hypothetical protein JXB39_12810, partial [Deltaproteobacteria bacterium]|nr:hypothetical protein [Deltaproteobacteria bacterium]